LCYLDSIGGGIVAFADTLKRLRLSKGLTQEELANGTGLAKSSISMYESGRRKPSFEVLEAFADFFNVDMNTLWETRPMEQSHARASDDLPDLTPKDEREIMHLMDDMKEKLMQEEGLMFDGQPASPESIQSILDAMQIGMEMAKKRNKAKYTPKKYRHED
jgi:Predicted transcriptional regulators